eukprot:7270871-Pyramimonas_sp.AAC.1
MSDFSGEEANGDVGALESQVELPGEPPTPLVVAPEAPQDPDGSPQRDIPDHPPQDTPPLFLPVEGRDERR